MVLRLSARPTGPETLVLSYPLPGRVVFTAMGALLTLGMLAAREFSAPMAALALVGGLVGLYDDTWTFDRRSGILTRRRGLPLLSIRREWPLGSVQAVLLRVVTGPGALESASPFDPDPGVPHLLRKGRAVLLLELDGAEARRIVVEDGSHRDREVLEAIGSKVSSFCGIPLRK